MSRHALAVAFLLSLLLATSPASASIPDLDAPPRPLLEEALLAELEATLERAAEADQRASAEPRTRRIHLVAPSTWPTAEVVHPCRGPRSWRSTCVLGYPVRSLLEPLEITPPEPVLAPAAARRGPENRVRGSNLADSVYLSGNTRFKGELASGLGEARFYDAELGLWLSEDPVLGDPMMPPSLHRYLYVHQNPTIYVDPDGRELTPFDVLAASTEACVDTVVDKAALVGRAAVAAADFSTGGNISAAREGLRTFNGSEGSLVERLEEAGNSANRARGAVLSGGFSEAEDKVLHAKELTGVAGMGRGVEQIKEGRREGDSEKVLRGFGELAGGVGQAAGFVAGVLEGGMRLFGGKGTPRLNAESPSQPGVATRAVDEVAALQPGTEVNSAGRLIDSTTKQWVTDPRPRPRSSGSANTSGRAVSGEAHGNSRQSARAQPGYEIVDTRTPTNEVVKTGVSGGRRTADGGSARANSQVNRWNREEGQSGRYQARVVKEIPEGPGARQQILEWEAEDAARFESPAS